MIKKDEINITQEIVLNDPFYLSTSMNTKVKVLSLINLQE